MAECRKKGCTNAPAPGRLTCSACLAIHRAANARYYHKLRGGRALLRRGPKPTRQFLPTALYPTFCSDRQMSNLGKGWCGALEWALVLHRLRHAS